MMLYRDSFNVQLYFSSFCRLYSVMLTVISICPMLKTGKMQSIPSSAILADLFKNYFKGAKIW